MKTGKTQPGSNLTAPVWHTSAVLALLLCLASLSMRVGGRGVDLPSRRRIDAYLVTITAEWLIVALIALGRRWRGASIGSLLGEHSTRWRSIVRDLGLAVAFLVVANTLVFSLSSVLGRFMHPAGSEAIQALLPHSRMELAPFMLLALTAAFCEEVIFRGYLQRQLTGWTKSTAAGVAVQGIAFGVCHAYQGKPQIVLIALYGCMFGLLAYWRGSLRPGMIAHFLQDGVGGLLLARFLLK